MPIRRKTPRPRRNFVAGPSLADAPALLAWLESHPDETIRVPVTIHFSQAGFRARSLAFIGTDVGSPPDGAILLDLDDSTLGIDLDTRLGSLCDTESETCIVWIEGFWGRVVPMPGAAEPPPWPLTVRDVGPIGDGSPATILVAAP